MVSSALSAPSLSALGNRSATGVVDRTAVRLSGHASVQRSPLQGRMASPGALGTRRSELAYFSGEYRFCTGYFGAHIRQQLAAMELVLRVLVLRPLRVARDRCGPECTTLGSRV